MKAPSTSLQMSASASSAAPTEQARIDEAVGALKERAVEFARLAPMASQLARALGCQRAPRAFQYSTASR